MSEILTTPAPENVPHRQAIDIVLHQSSPKEVARQNYQSSRRHQDHGSRQAYRGHVHLSETDPEFRSRPHPQAENFHTLREDSWTAADQAAVDASDFMHSLYKDDPEFYDLDDATDEEEFERTQSRQALANALLSKLDNGTITKQQAWEEFMADADLPAPTASERMAAELETHFRHSARKSPGRTLDNSSFEDTDYLGGLSIRRQ